MKKTNITCCVILMIVVTISTAAVNGADFTWAIKTPMQQSRSHSASVALNGKIYAIGGYVGGPSGTASVEEYDPASDTWTSKAPISNAVWGLRAGVANAKIYVFGGGAAQGATISTVEEYDPGTNAWTPKHPMSEAKYNMAIGVSEDKIYIIGGSRGDTAFGTTEQYDPLTDTWTTKTPMPVARHLAYFAATSDEIFLFGDPIYVYDMETDSWSTRAAPPFDNVGAPAATALNGKIYVLGGSYTWGSSGPLGITDVWEYDPSTDSWSAKTPMVTGVALLWQAASVVGNKVYVLGGQTAYPTQSTTLVQEGTLGPLMVDVAVDIKPGSCPNPLNVRSKGVLPVGVLGTAEFDVTAIDLASIRLAGVAPIRSGFEDVATPADGDECECTTAGPDGYIDLSLKFNIEDIVSAIGEVADGEVLELTLTGELLDGTAIEGSDCIVIIAK